MLDARDDVDELPRLNVRADLHHELRVPPQACRTI
jgi:hypothetical protein